MAYQYLKTICSPKQFRNYPGSLGDTLNLFGKSILYEMCIIKTYSFLNCNVLNE